jgi:PST family polysaccharide transporter
MGKIAIRYVVKKVIALIFTLIFVKSDSDVMLIPLFDAFASIIAIILVAFQLKKLGVKPQFDIRKIKESLSCLKSSFVYFISNFATTAFTALNTVLIGIFLSKTEVSYWSVAMQLVNAIHALYNPIINSVFPTMIKHKNLKLIHRIMLIYMPLIFFGCALILLFGDWAIPFVFGEEYLTTSTILKLLIPLIVISFPAMLYGWPCLGSINKQKITSLTTIIAAFSQVLGLVFLALIGQFNLIGLCCVRGISELVLCLTRVVVVYKNKKLFTNKTKIENNDIITSGEVNEGINL